MSAPARPAALRPKEGLVSHFSGSNSSADYHRDNNLVTQHNLTRVPLFRVSSRPHNGTAWTGSEATATHPEYEVEEENQELDQFHSSFDTHGWFRSASWR